MPIIEVVDGALPLTQGDVLTGVNLFGSAPDWSTVHSKSTNTCIIISRPCGVAHKSRMVVASVEKYKNDAPDSVKSFADTKSFLETIRDGHDTPDVFYLGHIPVLGAGRFAARLDSIHTLELPARENELQQLVAAKRVGRLATDFARDLHSRIFRAFASMGFDDERWYSDADLAWLITAAETEMATKQQSFAKAEAAGFRDDKQRAAMEAGISKTQAEYAPLKTEFERRRRRAH